MACADIIDRDLAEGNDLYTQLVSYVVIVNPESQRIFLGKRIGGEKRLLNSYCLGFGGHVNQEDISDKNDMLTNAAIRELSEEIRFYKKDPFETLTMIGFVRDMESETREHLGAAFLLIAGKATIKEENNLQGRWVSYDDLKNKYYEGLETWSRYILDYIYENNTWSQRLRF